MNQIKTQAPSLLKNLVEESQADGAILLLNVGGQVLHASIGKLDFTTVPHRFFAGVPRRHRLARPSTTRRPAGFLRPSKKVSFEIN